MTRHYTHEEIRLMPGGTVLTIPDDGTWVKLDNASYDWAHTTEGTIRSAYALFCAQPEPEVKHEWISMPSVHSNNVWVYGPDLGRVRRVQSLSSKVVRVGDGPIMVDEASDAQKWRTIAWRATVDGVEGFEDFCLGTTFASEAMGLAKKFVEDSVRSVQQPL